MNTKADRLQEEADKSKEELDDKYSDEKLQEIVDKTLNTGIFEDINGDLHSLQDVMLDYIDKYEDGMSAIGDIIKSEWITNLEIAKDTMREMSGILDDDNILDITKKENVTIDVKEQEDSPKEIIDDTSYSDQFKELDKDLSNMQDAMLDYADKYKDEVSSLGSAIESEWIDKLETVKDAMKEISGTLDGDDVLDITKKEDVITDIKEFEDGLKEIIDDASYSDKLDKDLSAMQDAMASLGSTIESEWIDNLDIAKDTMKEIADMLEKLNFGDFESMPTLSMNSLNTIPQSAIPSQTIQFDKPLIVVEGNVDKDVMTDLESLAVKLKKDLLNEIVQSIR